MTEEQFWNQIDQARSGSASASPDRLKELLAPLSNNEVSDFGLIFYEKLCDLNTWRLWAAGNLIVGWMDQESFHYFRSWIIGKGREAFETARLDPDGLGPYIDDAELNNEPLEYVAVLLLLAHKQPGPRERTQRDADGEPTGVPFDESTLSKMFPKLAAQFE
jgi:hypothetical protein